MAPIHVDNLEISTEGCQITPRLRKNQHTFSAKEVVSNKTFDASSEIQLIGEKKLASSVLEMTNQADIVYNSQLHAERAGHMKSTVHPGQGLGSTNDSLQDQEDINENIDVRQSNLSSGGKLPHYGARRMVKPTVVMSSAYENSRTSWQVSSSEFDNYEAICQLSASKWSNENVVDLGGVRCTFWSLGQSLMQRGVVNNFVIAAFCRHLFLKPNGHPDKSKRHYFFPSISDNLLKDMSNADQEVLRNAFTRSTKARPLPSSNMLFFPTSYQGHWFVFVVDIKDQCFVFLDPHYTSEDEFHGHVRERLITSFVIHWNKYVKVDKAFEEYKILYPHMPKHGIEKMYDSGIYAMMSLEHWTSPRTVLATIFQPKDVPKIRVKIANSLVFTTRNTGRKDLIISFDMQENNIIAE